MRLAQKPYCVASHCHWNGKCAQFITSLYCIHFMLKSKRKAPKNVFAGTTVQYTVSEAFLMEGGIRDKSVVINKIA